MDVFEDGGKRGRWDKREYESLKNRQAGIDKLARMHIIPPNTLKDFEEDEYALYGGQRTGCYRWKSCPHDGAEWTSELQSETIAGR
jgi:hypothetical protein